MQKIVYLMQVPLSLREFTTFGLEYFAKCGFQVEVWECTGFLNPHLQAKDFTSLAKAGAQGEKIGKGNVFALRYQFNAAKNVVQALQSELLPHTAFINLLPKNRLALPVFAALSALAAQSVEVRTNAIPQGPLNLIKKLKTLSPGRLFDFFLRRRACWQKRAGLPKSIIYGGACCRPGADELAPNGQMLSAHALDFDSFMDYCQAQNLPVHALQNLAAALPKPKKQIVFLDQNLPFHSDFKVLKKRPPVTPELYFPALCNFFSKLERALSMPVIIAGHPRANYEENCPYFGGRKIIFAQSMALVCESSLVLMHHSTAVNFAVMARRPVLVLSSNELEQSDGAPMHLIAQNLGAPLVNVDQNPFRAKHWAEHFLVVNEAAYAAYMQKYIKESGSPNLPFWQILEQNLLQTTQKFH